jgi:hypothetical protein
MTFFHVLNFAIPIAAMVGFGIVLDRMCKPVAKQEKINE